MERTTRTINRVCPNSSARLRAALVGLTVVASLAATARAQDPAILNEPDMAVRALLQTNPSTPAEWINAADILRQLDRLELAKQFVDKAAAANLTEEQLLALGEELGQQMFLNLAAEQALNPEARKLADAVTAALNKQRRDPDRLKRLVDDLQQQPAEAMAELRSSGAQAVVPMLAVLADEDQKDRHATVRAALNELGYAAIGPLLGVLEGGPPELAAEAIRVLARVNTARATLPLLAVAYSPQRDPRVRALARAALQRQYDAPPTPEEARQLLARAADEHFNRDRPARGVIGDRITFWRWDDDTQTLVPEEYDGDHARRALAAQFARGAYELAPEDAALRRLHLATLLERAQFEAGLDQPLPSGEGSAAAEVAEHGMDAVEDVLAWSMENDHPAAAAAAARILGRIGTPDDLLYQGAEATPLVLATVHPDRRVRLAALEAIVALDPREPFAGSNHVARALAFLLRTSGQRRALVASPKRADAMKLAGWLAGAGFRSDAATTGREVARLATTSPDYEMALINADITSPLAEELLQMLRYDDRSADLLVDLVARDGSFEQGRRIARADPLAVSAPWPHDGESLAWQIEQLNKASAEYDGALFVPFEARQAMAASAADMLIALSEPAEGDTGAARPWFALAEVEDAVHKALLVPALADRAVTLLGRIGTPRAQTTLVELASRGSTPVDLRRAAAEALGANIQRHGILLETGQLQRQYDLYNASEHADRQTQQVLGKILDHLEAPTLKAKP